MEILKELKWRGLLKDVANEENLNEIFLSNKSFYVGIDPTADSMHIGHYMILSLSKILNNAGLKPVFVIGGFTGMIGDPSGKISERGVIYPEIIAKNVKSLEILITDLANKLKIKDFKIVNNYHYYKDLTLLKFFQTYGKYFNVNSMLGKDMVKTRLEAGISYTEFSYQILQSIDFLKLYEEEGVNLQIAGSDQWGNIVSGIELIRKVRGVDTKVAGLTVNLLVDRNGDKIGKTAGNPVWVDEKKFSRYSFFQYLLNRDDETVKLMLLALSQITKDEYVELVEKSLDHSSSKLIHHELAQRLMSQIYDDKAYDEAVKSSELIFKEKYSDLSIDQAKDAFSSIPTINKIKETLIETLIDSRLISSRREYREFLKMGAIKINGQSVESEDYKISNQTYINNQFIIVNVGKKKRFIIWK